MKRTSPSLAIVAAALLFFTACAGTDTPPEGGPVAGETLDGSLEESPEDPGGPKVPAKEKEGKPGGGRKENALDEKKEPGGGSGPQDNGSADSTASSEASGAPEDGQAADLSPAAGSYTYAQQGYEEFCSGASCDRSDLPDRQAITLQLLGRSAAGDEVLSEIKGPGDRLVQTTTVYGAGEASVTRVYLRMGYEGFVFENEYQPAPPVQILHFPLKPGDAWRGSWEADTSGTYRARVVGSETLSIRGRSVEAFKVSTTTTFRGEFEGTSDAQVWIDPQTRAVLRTSGLLRLKTNLGGYNTAFQTDLVSGPSY